MRRVAVLGAAAADASARPLAEADEIVVLDPSPAALLGVLEEVADPRYAFLLGGLPVLPLPDAWVDEVIGAEGDDAELARVRR